VSVSPAPSVVSTPSVSPAPSPVVANIPWPDALEVRAHMKSAFTPELRGAVGAVRNKPEQAYSWQQAVFYVGVSAAWQATGDNDYHTALVKWGESTQWQLGARPRNADDLACGQAYLELYQREGGPERIAAIRTRVDAFLSAPQPGHKDWSWCESFFMAPPVFVKLSAVTSDAHYREALRPLLLDAIATLWDKPNQLFYRDATFIGQPEDGFWARGNSMVLAGLARVLDVLPPNDAGRPRYEEIFKTLAARIVKLQGEDGAWRSSLLYPQTFPQPESGSTALFAYGLAWGVNHGLLANADYAPAVIKAWAALEHAQLPNGRLGGVQRKGFEPGDTKPTDTAYNGGGAFLLLGSELLPHPLPPKP
jgi:unsaturated rhamnogalacturonyl hydrolase